MYTSDDLASLVSGTTQQQRMHGCDRFLGTCAGTLRQLSLERLVVDLAAIPLLPHLELLSLWSISFGSTVSIGHILLAISHQCPASSVLGIDAPSLDATHDEETGQIRRKICFPTLRNLTHASNQGVWRSYYYRP